jgi:dihydropteroate synthase
MPRPRFQIPLPHRTLELGERTLVMGILNVTPDSFSERGRYFDRNAAITRGLEIEREGADILDIGGESTRPGAEPVSAEEELDRTIPVIEALRRKKLKIPISIDTYKAAVANRALQAGAEIVNDVSGLRYDACLAAVVSSHHAGMILMHLRGTPRTMQQLPAVKRIIPAIASGWAASLRRARASGIARRCIVLDPGVGFGKSVDQNFEILAGGLARLARMGYPILVGPSRKFFIRKTVESLLRKQTARRGRTPTVASAVGEEVLFGTAAAVTAAILSGAHIVRVHDVRQMRPAVLLADRLIQ